MRAEAACPALSRRCGCAREETTGGAAGTIWWTGGGNCAWRSRLLATAGGPRRIPLMCDGIRERGNSAGPAWLVLTVRPVWAGQRVDRLSPAFLSTTECGAV